MLRQGSGPPLVLLHGVLGAEGMWRRVIPLLSPHHDTIAFTALGHRGGRSPAERPARIAHVVDDAERFLDELRLDKAHLAGNSMGGWVALELARRGRALSVCGLSPAGCWPPLVGGEARPAAMKLGRAVRDTRMGRRVLPLLARFSRFRRWALRVTAAHGHRVSARDLVELADDLLGCAISRDLLASNEHLEPIDPLPCPITLAWSARDRIFPPAINGEIARKLMPGARFVVLDDVGHVPMIDDPALVARTILETTRVAR
jgi:pimeloyl-ACP methyl ester carboxylesterase